MTPDGPRLLDLLRQAVDFRGDVTIELDSGERIEGFAFDLHEMPGGHCELRLLPSAGGERRSIPVGSIVGASLSGKDAASGKSWENWIRRYAAKKLAGEEASIESERLDV